MDEVIAELESDKATFELTAEIAGILKTVVNEGDTLPIGAVVASIEAHGISSTPEKNDEPAAQPQPEVVANAPAPAPANAVPETPADAPDAVNTSPLEVKVPTVGESITEVTLSRWIKKDGDSIVMDEAIAELESDKATFELTAEKAGVLKTIAKEGDVLPIGATVCTIAGSGTSAFNAPAPVTALSAARTDIPATNGKATYASGVPSPAAAKILAEKGVDASAISGSGVAGRITKEDALLAQKISESPQAPKENGSVKAPVATPAPLKTEALAVGTRTDRREKMSSLRKTVAKRLVAVKNETAMLTTFNEVDMSPVMELRAKYKDKF